jgi:hypothetical protein
VWWVPCAAAIVLVAAGVWQARRRYARQRELMRLCHRAGLKFRPIDPFPDTMWLPFRVFGKGTERGTENVVWDPRDDPSDVRVFDHWYVEEGPDDAPGLDRRHRMTCAAVALPFTCPRLEVVPQSSLDPLAGEDVQLELEAFNRRFRVVAEDRRFAVAFLDARMMAALLRLPLGISCEVHEDRMLLWAPQVSAAETVLLLEVARKLRERVPSVVASLYPPRPSEAPQEARWLQGHWSPEPAGPEPAST